ncbi:MAG: hypothetical protein WAM04_19185 [Candidatus Sulfotelmatobacter sp.]
MLSARALDGVKVAVSLDALYVTTPLTDAASGPVNVKVVLLIVAGFIAALKAAVTGALGQTPTAALRGTTETTVGAAKTGLAPGLQHPGLKMSRRSAMDQIAQLLYLRMTVILLPSGLPRAAK